jgi:hypothetical protein
MNDNFYVLDRDYEMCILNPLVNIITIILAFAVGTIQPLRTLFYWTVLASYAVRNSVFWH